MAHRLLLIDCAMWLAVAQPPVSADAVEQLLPRLEAIARFTAELDVRLASAGVDGIAGALEVHRRLSSVFARLPAEEIRRMQATVGALAAGLEALSRTLTDVARLRSLVLG